MIDLAVRDWGVDEEMFGQAAMLMFADIVAHEEISIPSDVPEDERATRAALC